MPPLGEAGVARVIPAKVTPPRSGGAIARPRLFARLEAAEERRVVWLAAPPGAGKTTLVERYLATTDIPFLWYRVDATDNDIGSFFHHMSLAASVVCGLPDAGLPRFGPEYAGGGEVFTRNYFRQLFERIPSPLLVFDDYQKVGTDSPLHEVVATGIAELPAGYRVMVLSRSLPPREFARLQGTRSLELLSPEAFLLTEDETAALCRTFGEAHGLRLPSESCATLHQRCGGWVTGLVLMLEARRTRGSQSERDEGPVPAVVFDYFASEILAQTESDTERVLLSTAMLDEISPELAVALSGIADAGRRLDGLSQRGYFTVRHEGATSTWTYHQLFREFLMRQAESQLGADGWSAVQSRAARELEARGNVEQAIELHLHLRDWPSTVPLLASCAPPMLVQGRHRTLLRWVGDIPVEVQERSPWLLYWSAMAGMLFDPASATDRFERAFRLFLADGDVRGTCLAWAVGVQNIFYEQRDYRSFDRKIEEIEPVLQRFELPDETVEALVYTGLAQCVIWRGLDHPSRDRWIERALELEGRLPDLGFRIQFLALAHAAFIFSGEASRRRRVLNLLQNLVEALPSSSLVINVLRAVQSLDLWVRAEFESSIIALEEGLDAAEGTGVGVMIPLTLSVGAANASSLGDRQLVGRYLSRMEATVDPARRHDYGFLQLGRSGEASLAGDWPSALDWIERAGITLEPLGVPVYSAQCDIVQGLARHYLGDSEAGLALLERARERVGLHAGWLRFGAAMAEAEITLDAGRRTAALEALTAALAIGRESGIWNFTGWRREPLSRLCAEALAACIEVPYTLRLIEKHALLPPDTAELDLDSWPWPVVVHTLGGLALQLRGSPVQFSGKVPRVPLQLFELLVLRGGVQVPEDWLADALWPDAEGDAAANSLSTTILRLRRLLEVKDVLIRRNRCLTLNRQRCWVDAWALEAKLQTLPVLQDIDSIASAAERAMALYRGSFMPQSDLPATLAYRDRLFGRTFEGLDVAVRRVAAGGEPERAKALHARLRDLRRRVDPTA